MVERFLRKGSKVYIEGQLQTRKWQDQQGNDRYSTEVVLRGLNGTLTMLDGAQGGGNRGGGGGGGDWNQGGGGQSSGGGDNWRSGGGSAGGAGGFGGGASGGSGGGSNYDDLDDDIPF